jgi:phosphate transport system permease protein
MTISNFYSQQSPTIADESILSTRRLINLDRLFAQVSRAIAIGVVALLLWLGWVIFQQALPAIKQFGSGFLTSSEWDPNNLLFGALPYIYGTLVSSLLALLFAVPIGLAIAIVTSENFLPKPLRLPIIFLVELIAAIPSVIIGFWGIFVLIPILQPLQIWIHQKFGWIPLFSTETSGYSMFVAAVVLAVMILPTIASISRDVIQAVPQELRSASVALGATRWEMILSVVLPSSLSGIVGAVMLALGRALGETMAVTMVIGNSDQLNISLFDAANTIPAILANQFAEAYDAVHIGALMYLALILFVLTLVVNIAAVYLVQAFSFKQK